MTLKNSLKDLNQNSYIIIYSADGLCLGTYPTGALLTNLEKDYDLATFRKADNIGFKFIAILDLRYSSSDIDKFHDYIISLQ